MLSELECHPQEEKLGYGEVTYQSRLKPSHTPFFHMESSGGLFLMTSLDINYAHVVKKVQCIHIDTVYKIHNQ